MSEPPLSTSGKETLPEARIRRRRAIPSMAWLLPLLAAIVTGILAYGRFQEYGPTITIRFKDGNGVRAGQTPLKYRGVPIGEVKSVALSADQQYVNVEVRLERSAASVARERSTFWIVRPEVEIGSVSGLGTVLSGPEIQVLPGSGAPHAEFIGMDRAPVALEQGLRIVLRTAHPGSLRRGSPAYYRGVEVGVVRDITLAPQAIAADIHVVIREQYASLVRGDSAFWNVSGARVSGGLFKGIDVRVESLRALVAGGVAFATPPGGDARRVKDGSVFALHARPRADWLQWAPRIAISPKDEPPESAPAQAIGSAGAQAPG